MDAERERLGSIQTSVDGFSQSVLSSLGLTAAARCLEIGPGAGSIAAWLASRHADVVAVDKDLSTYGAERPTNLHLVEDDILASRDWGGPFDLIHARFVCCHLPTRNALLAQAVEWLAPGGWLVVTDPYQLPAATSPYPVLQRLLAAYEQRYRNRGTDLTWSRGLPALLAATGLTELGHAGYLGCLGNGDRDRWRPLIEPVLPELIETGLITAADVEQWRAELADPAFVDIPQFTLAAWGRRPR